MNRPLNQISAIQDLWQGLENIQIWLYLAKFDIRGRYRRTILGPLWTSLNALFFILIIAGVYSKFWGQTVADFLPYVAAGYFVWIFISTSLLESCSIYFASGAFLQAAPISPIVFNLRVIARNLIVFGHSFLVFICIALYSGVTLRYFAWIVPGIITLAFMCFFASVILSILCARYRDFEQVLNSIILAAFFVTPILYEIKLLEGKEPGFLKFNIFTYMIDIVREPMLGKQPNIDSYFICFGAIGILFVVALLSYVGSRKKLYLWI